MNECIKWVAITKTEDGAVRIFHKWVDEEQNGAVDAFREEVEGWGVIIYAMFRKDDVDMVCSL